MIMAKYDNGWIKYYRKSERNKLYFSEPFDRWHAWTDLLLMCNPYDPKNENPKGKPGTLKTSLEALRIRWSWNSKHKVREFLGTLAGTFMIDLKTSKGKDGGVLITIKNFEDYQKEREHKKKAQKKDDGNINGNMRRNTSLYPTRIYKEEGIFESSPEGDSKTPSEEKNSSGRVMSGEAFLKSLEEGK